MEILQQKWLDLNVADLEESTPQPHNPIGLTPRESETLPKLRGREVNLSLTNLLSLNRVSHRNLTIDTTI